MERCSHADPHRAHQNEPACEATTRNIRVTLPPNFFGTTLRRLLSEISKSSRIRGTSSRMKKASLLVRKPTKHPSSASASPCPHVDAPWSYARVSRERLVSSWCRRDPLRARVFLLVIGTRRCTRWGLRLCLKRQAWKTFRLTARMPILQRTKSNRPEEPLRIT